MPSSTQEIGHRSKGDPITKRFTAKFPCPPAPWSNFQLLERSEASGLKIRENAYRASGSERSQKEKPLKVLCQPGASEALLAFWKPGVHTAYQEPKESSHLSVRLSRCITHTPVGYSRMSTELSHTVCLALIFFLTVNCVHSRDEAQRGEGTAQNPRVCGHFVISPPPFDQQQLSSFQCLNFLMCQIGIMNASEDCD